MPSRKKVAASTATRQVRWVEGFKTVAKGEEQQPVFWGQVKKVERGERTIDVPTDRRSNFAFPAKGKGKPIIKHSATTQKTLQDAANKIIGLIQKIADGDVTSFFYSAEAGTLRYSQKIDVDGTSITENKETDDETLIEAAQDFADLVADETASEGKPLSVVEGQVAGPALEEDDED